MSKPIISITVKNDWKNTFNFLKKVPGKLSLDSILNMYGHKGVEALKNATPVATGKTSESWYYEIEKGKDYVRLNFNNSNVVDGNNIAILIQYGHGTKNGGYVVGRDYINPALKPIFDELADSAWKEINKS